MKKQFGIFKKVQIGIIFFLLTLFPILGIPACVITSCHIMGIIGSILMVVGIIISVWYEIAGGYIKHQKLENKLFKIFAKKFEIPQPGRIAKAIFFSIGGGFTLAGAILLLYVYILCWLIALSTPPAYSFYSQFQCLFLQPLLVFSPYFTNITDKLKTLGHSAPQR